MSKLWSIFTAVSTDKEYKNNYGMHDCHAGHPILIWFKGQEKTPKTNQEILLHYFFLFCPQKILTHSQCAGVSMASRILSEEFLIKGKEIFNRSISWNG